MEEFATNPVAEGESAQGAEVAPEAEEQTEGEVEGSEAEEDPEQPEDDTEEVEFDGQTYRIPKALKDSFLRQADYTRKTQEVAEQRRALEQQQQQLAQQVQAHQEHIKEVARLYALDEQLEQFSRVNWQQLNEQDPSQAQALWFQYQQLKDNRSALAGQLQQKEQQRAIEAQQAAAKRLEEAQAVLKRDIPGWGPELANKVKDYALSQGLTEQELSGVTDPKFVKILHDAYVGRQLREKQRAPRPQPQNPVPQVGASRANAAKDPRRMSTAEWMEWRNKQVARKGR